MNAHTRELLFIDYYHLLWYNTSKEGEVSL